MTELETLLGYKIEKVTTANKCRMVILGHLVKRYLPTNYRGLNVYGLDKTALELNALLEMKTKSLLNLVDEIGFDTLVENKHIYQDLLMYLNDVNIIKRRIFKDVERAKTTKKALLTKYMEIRRVKNELFYDVKHPRKYCDKTGLSKKEVFNNFEEAKAYEKLMIQTLFDLGIIKSLVKSTALGCYIHREENLITEEVTYVVYHDPRSKHYFENEDFKTFDNILDAVSYKKETVDKIKDIKLAYKREKMLDFLKSVEHRTGSQKG